MADPTLQAREEFLKELSASLWAGVFRPALCQAAVMKFEKAIRASALREAVNMQCIGCRENWDAQGTPGVKFHCDPKSGGIIVCQSNLLALLGETEEGG